MTYPNLSHALLAVIFLIAPPSNAEERRLETTSPIERFENNLSEPAKWIPSGTNVALFNIRDRMKYYGVPSVSLAVIHHGAIAWAKAYGFAQMEGKREADAMTLYQAGSLSKTVNALLIMRLVQDGTLSLERDVRTYFKAWLFPENDLSRNKPITLLQLLSHTAGLSVHGFKGYARGEPIPSLNEMLEGKPPANNEKIRSIHAPGSLEEYSGGGTLVTRQIIEEQTRQTYESIITVTILDPLGMSNSTYSQPLPSATRNFAVGYDDNMREIEGRYYTYPELAPDGLWTTPSDYARVVIEIQRSFGAQSNAILSSANAQRMLAPVSGTAALGVFMKEKGGEKYFSHTGKNVGFSTAFVASFSTGNGVVVMANSDNDKILDEIINDVASVYNWKGFYDPEVRTIVEVPDSFKEDLVGDYYCDSPKITVHVAKFDGVLKLNTHAGAANFEKMYFTGPRRFFLASSPGTIGEFGGDDARLSGELLISESGRVLFTAKKR